MSTESSDLVGDLWRVRRDWLPDLLAGLLVLVIGSYEAATTAYFAGTRETMLAIALATAVAVGLSRRLPSVALALVWLTCGYQVLSTSPLMAVQVTIAAVAFGTARWGRPLTVLLSAISIPAAGALATTYADPRIIYSLVDINQYKRLIDVVQQFGATWQIAAAILGMAVLGVPWLAGLTLRFSARASDSRASQQIAEEEAARAHLESEQAREIARLREEQAQLAHDVHDVVGHSLAVILAQAESAQFLDETDTTALRTSMANIAASARSSLQDVRRVLAAESAPTSGPGELHDLVAGVRASGHEVRFDEVGTPRPLAPELATVAYRVLQEMLTNAIRHGARPERVDVELHWAEELRIEVVNTVGVHGGPDDGPDEHDGGQGVEGMRRRLTSVGGRLDLRRREVGSGETFTATAWVPVRTVYP